MTNNKKKTAKEKRVLIASLVVAAIMIGGSTFAWFSSKDEVTNRLSANADYNVSIVESFEPPANWIPGQIVNKDVYAVNTGNIPAFVKEELSGKLTVTTEVPTNIATPAADSVKLTEAERYVIEAGAYLALKPDSSNAQIGNKIVSMTPDSSNLDGYTAGATDFTPDAEGLYVFRRAINVDDTNRTEKFTYEGYYYKGGDFYKISNLTTTPDTTPDFAGDGVSTDGNLASATCGFYKEETKVLTPKLTYDATNNRLVATVDTGSHGESYDDLSAAATAYDKALEDYQLALAAYNAATNENNTASADVADKKADMDAASVALANAIADLQAATDAKAAADAKVADLTAQKAAVDTEVSTATATRTAKLNAKDDADAAVAAAVAAAEDNVATQFAADVQSKLGKTVANCTYAELNGLFGTDYANYNYYQLVVAQKKAQEEYDAADAALTAATAKQASVVAALATAQSEQSTAATNLTDKQDAKDDAQTAFDTAKTAYENAVSASGTQSTNLTYAKSKLSEASQTLANAEAKYNELNDSVSGATELKININLSDAVTTAGGTANMWQHTPTANDDDIATFYYTSILEGSETSSKLVDSVELDPSVTADMYKAFDFDLNVAMKSVQVNYDQDDVTIKSDHVSAELGKTPTLTNNKDINTPLSWS